MNKQLQQQPLNPSAPLAELAQRLAKGKSLRELVQAARWRRKRRLSKAEADGERDADGDSEADGDLDTDADADGETETAPLILSSSECFRIPRNSMYVISKLSALSLAK